MSFLNCSSASQMRQRPDELPIEGSCVQRVWAIDAQSHQI
jgi:hypothetical protein